MRDAAIVREGGREKGKKKTEGSTKVRRVHAQLTRATASFCADSPPNVVRYVRETRRSWAREAPIPDALNGPNERKRGNEPGRGTRGMGPDAEADRSQYAMSPVSSVDPKWAISSHVPAPGHVGAQARDLKKSGDRGTHRMERGPKYIRTHVQT